VDKISKIATLFREHSSDLGAFLASDPKGLQIPGYLSQLGERLAKEQEALLEELGRLQKGVEHIRSIVATQQSLARAGGRHEILKISEVVDEALSISSMSEAGRGVAMVREINTDVCVTTDKHMVLQILLNLLGNAKQACEAADCQEKTVTVRAMNSGSNVRIAVSDTGIGIPSENLERMFTHGFTTKRNGHGFGLYSSSTAAKELGGSLKVESQGANKGATFTLDLPCSIPVCPQ
jgi:signal transduction histidine kinase